MIAAVVLTAQAAWGDNGLTITEVKFNGISVNDTIVTHPLDQVSFLVTLSNSQAQMITNINTGLIEGTTQLASSGQINIAGNTTQTVTLNFNVPWNFGMGVHNLVISSVGKDFNLAPASNSFSVKVNVTQNLNNPTTYITSTSVDTSNVDCNNQVTLTVKVANTGNTVEDDLIFKITQNGNLIYTSPSVQSLGANSEGSFPIVLTKNVLTSGPLSVSLYYRNFAYTDSKTNVHTITKSDCLSGANPSGDVTIYEGTSQLFSVSVKDQNLPVSWTLDGNTIIPTTKTTYNLVSPTVGTHTLTVTAGADSKTWKVTVTLPPEPTPASLQVSSLSTIALAQSDLGKTLTKTVTLSNPGTLEALTNLTYTSTSASISVTGLKDVPAKGSIEVTLSVAVPSTLTSGEITFGTLTFKANNNLSATLPVKVNYASLLKVTDVEINGDNNGEITPDSDNTVDVTVKNEYTKDIENIVVTATLRDVDNDDLEEESEEFDLNNGDDDTVTLTFDLSGENLDEDSYTLDITVSGEDVDGNDQETTYTEIVDVSRDSHKIILRNVDLSSNSVQCLKQTTLNAEVRNVGKSNENNIEIRVKNTALGIDLSKKDIDLDKYSGNDNSYEATFNLEVESAKAGTYPLSVESYLDGDLEDSVIVNLEVRDCGSGSTSMSSSSNYDQLAANLQKQLQAELEAQKANAQKNIVPVAETSFRDSNAYLWMLGALGLLIVIAVILGLAAASKK